MAASKSNRSRNDKSSSPEPIVPPPPQQVAIEVVVSLPRPPEPKTFLDVVESDLFDGKTCTLKASQMFGPDLDPSVFEGDQWSKRASKMVLKYMGELFGRPNKPRLNDDGTATHIEIVEITDAAEGKEAAISFRLIRQPWMEKSADQMLSFRVCWICGDDINTFGHQQDGGFDPMETGMCYECWEEIGLHRLPRLLDFGGNPRGLESKDSQEEEAVWDRSREDYEDQSHDRLEDNGPG